MSQAAAPFPFLEDADRVATPAGAGAAFGLGVAGTARRRGRLDGPAPSSDVGARMRQLGPDALASLADGVAVPAYDRRGVSVGIEAALTAGRRDPAVGKAVVHPQT